jgi:hypothetical protein
MAKGFLYLVAEPPLFDPFRRLLDLRCLTVNARFSKSRFLQLILNWHNVDFWLVQLDLATLKFNVITQTWFFIRIYSIYLIKVKP